MEFSRNNLHYDIPQACIRCGTVLDKGRGTVDHYIPLCVTGSRAERRNGTRNPFLVIVKDPNNLFKICCEEAHSEVDDAKTAAFLQLGPDDSVCDYLEKIRQPHTKRGNPEALITYLMKSYPITPNKKFRAVQIRRMITINNQFRTVANQLNGDLDHDLTAKYLAAAKLISVFNKGLHSLKTSNGLSVDLEAKSCYDLAHQASTI